MIFVLFMLFLIAQRLSELIISSRNEKWLLQNGAVEYGQAHYPYLITLHTLFILSLIAEYYMRSSHQPHYLLIALFFLLIAMKTGIIYILGRYWTTKIYRIPGTKPISTGIYRYLKHPNYIIVIIEIAVIPMAFGLYYTALAFSMLNAIMLAIRIPQENRALAG